MTQRIRVVGGPWPTRIGREGSIVEPDADEARVYPFNGLGRTEVVIKLDRDPIWGPLGAGKRWTCVIGRADVEFLP
jgi:hypothetical protein